MYLFHRCFASVAKIFCKKVGKKFGLRGKTAVPLQPQTGNGEKLLPLQSRPSGAGRGH